ncbi:pyruvate dehydrogenase [Patulibacter sp.]|uniref:pyruvate dehydrogenase n=1 Tax=Patulibacter sp. TaxID=1912859 RepID=UPI00272924C8|nr:pyruvate dehydrogenase [Patulibacter sp.]MDO9408226.1 pyruvate dehydrogenase [Patulibacter sp.]
MNVAEQLVHVLQRAGVQRVYGLVGDSLNPVVDAIRRTDGIEWIHVHNEEAAAFAAAADAQVTGRLAVCAGSCGPGNTHLIQGLYDAQRSGAPVLAIASHIPSDQIGTSFFQETHPERVFVDCSGWCETVSRAEQMPRLARIGVQRAIGDEAVSVLVLSGDVADLPVDAPLGDEGFVEARGALAPPASQVRELADAINAAEKVVLFCGAGAKDARDELFALADAANAPIGHTLRGKEWLQYDNPYDVGMSGLLGYGACYEAMDDADLVVLVGTDFPYPEFLPGTRTAQIDRDLGRIGRRTPVQVAVHGDVRATLLALRPLLRAKPDRSFLDRMLARHVKILTGAISAYTGDAKQRSPIHPEYVASVLDELAADDAIFTVDTGMNNVWAARYLSPNGRRRVMGSFWHGSMANALPHAIGAQFAQPGRQVISMSGDGGLAMLLGELLTVRRHALPVKTIVFNNSSLGMVKLEMLVEGLPSFGTDHDGVDYATIAAGVGIPSLRIEDPGELRAGLAKALATDGPVLVDVVTDANALSMPPHISAQQIRGFAMAAGKTVLGGGVGRMVDLATSNLRNAKALG